MAVRPAQIRYLAAGKALGASIHSGWAATWNWVLSWIAHFKPGKGLSVTGAQSGFPKADVLIEGVGGIEVTCAGDGQPYQIGLASESSSGDDSGGDVVTSLNDGTGDMDIIGGEGIRVSTDGQTITVSYEEGKAPDEDPNEEEDDGAGYCNDISRDDGKGGDMHDLTGAGVGDNNEISEDPGGDNDISNDPCKRKAA